MTPESALGIIFPNMHDDAIPELIAHRTMASVPFAGRYRMIDFCLSGMASTGMRNIGVIVQKNYQSLMDHLGSGREWDLSSKRGGMVIFPPYGRDTGAMDNGRLSSLRSVLAYLEANREQLVVMSDCDNAFNLDFGNLVDTHLASGADVTTVYAKAAIPDGMKRDNITYTLNDEGLVTDVRINDYRKGPQNISMNIYVIGREYLIGVIREAQSRNHTFFERDFLSRNLKMLKVRGYEYTGYRARIYDMRSYFEESLRLLNPANLEKLFPKERAILTKVRDEAPVRYAMDAEANNSLVADGCIIEGVVDNSVVFRGVRIGKGARVKGCVLMQGTEVAAGVVMENVITDKNAVIRPGVNLTGASHYPVFIGKNSVVE